MSSRARQWAGPAVFTLVLILLVSVASAEGFSLFNLAVVGVAALGVGFFYALFPHSQVLGVALANSLAVYACVYIFIVKNNFPLVDYRLYPIFFALPLVAFLVGALRQKDAIRRIIIEGALPDERKLGHSVRWLIPSGAIAISTFLVPGLGLGREASDIVFVVAMTVTSVLVYAASPGVTAFLVDTGALFQDLITRIRQLAAPAFAFLTFYSLNVIVFACIYQIIDTFTVRHMFLIHDTLQSMTFTDSLYFSIISLSTVGYGDIVPANDAVRVVVAIQVVFGILLLLFGFNEIISHSRRQGKRDLRERE
ncbi:MAG: hypothetical protein GY791_02860 [Alphaproteobacteria bacterium]|nr:hypothetical protein [Alphaproteobacteria bacterium]